MPDIYETSDGKRFEGHSSAVLHQIDLDREGSRSSGGSSGPSKHDILQSKWRNSIIGEYNDAVNLFNAGKYDEALEKCNGHSSITRFNEQLSFKNVGDARPEFLPKLLNVRGCCYNAKGNREQAIADFKLSADFGDGNSTYYSVAVFGTFTEGLENLAKMGIKYNPNILVPIEYEMRPIVKYIIKEKNHQGSYFTPEMVEKDTNALNELISNWESNAGRKMTQEDEIRIAGVPFPIVKSSSSSSSSKGNGFTDFLENIGFEDADYPGYTIKPPLSIIISLVITAGITFLAYLFLPSVWISAVVALVLSLMSTFLLNKKLLVILSIIAVIGIGLGVYGIVSPSKPKTETAATATVNANVNFRAEPSTGDNIIRQLQQGETVTLTGKTSGNWTQVRHGRDTGWISTEYLKSTTPP
jgi:hypothetical protein